MSALHNIAITEQSVIREIRQFETARSGRALIAPYLTSKQSTQTINTNNQHPQKRGKVSITMDKKNTIKTIGGNEKKISTFNGSSVRKWAEAVRKSGKLPKVYYYLATEPIRDENGTRVLVEGKWRIGCYIKGRPADFAQFVAGFGFKLPVSGTKERCKELFEEYRAAISQTGKYAPKAKKGTK